MVDKEFRLSVRSPNEEIKYLYRRLVEKSDEIDRLRAELAAMTASKDEWRQTALIILFGTAQHFLEPDGVPTETVGEQ